MGATRVAAGRIDGVRTVVGALYGPTWTREFLVATDDKGSLAYARTEDMTGDALERVVNNPQTVTEARMAIGAQSDTWLRLASILGPLRVKS